MSNRTKKFAIALLVMSLLLIGIVGAAQAQTPGPTDTATPNRLQQMQERMGPEAWGQMIQRMTDRMGAEAAGQMLQRMASDEDCHGDGEGHAGMTGMRGHAAGMMGRSGGMMDRFGRMMNGIRQGMGGMMGSWH